MYDDLIYFKEDVAREYCKRRKNINPKEVEDIINCLIKFLKKDIEEENQYAYAFNGLGTLYKGFYTEYAQEEWGKPTKRLNQQWLDITLKQPNKLEQLTLLERHFPNKTLEEIQKWQNETS